MVYTPFLLPAVGTSVLREIFGNDAYKLDDTNDYEIVGYMTTPKNGRYDIVYTTICSKRAVYDGEQWITTTRIVSQKYKITGIEPNSKLDTFIQNHDEYDDYDDCEGDNIPERPFEVY